MIPHLLVSELNHAAETPVRAEDTLGFVLWKTSGNTLPLESYHCFGMLFFFLISSIFSSCFFFFPVQSRKICLI